MPGKRKAKKEVVPASHSNGGSGKAMRDKSSQEPMAVSSSLHSIHISPRTPKNPREYDDVEDDVELNLLGEEERIRASQGLDDERIPPGSAGRKPMSAKDKRAMVLLCVLCQSFDLPVLIFSDMNQI